MKKTILSAASVLAIMAAAPAYADNVNTQTDASANVQTERTQQQQNDNALERGWDNTQRAVSETASDVSEATQETYEDIKAAFIDDHESTEITDVTINERNTANAMIGSTVYNTNGEAVGTLNDIILDANGNATMAIIADGELFGLGKTAAFDYSILRNQNQDGDVIAPLSEEAIDQAAEFSYDAEDASDDVRVMPANGYSVAELLEADLVNAQGDVVADVENISFSGAQAENLILSFNEILGMGGNKAAMAFSDAQIVRDEGLMGGTGYNFQLSASQSTQFENYKNRF